MTGAVLAQHTTEHPIAGHDHILQRALWEDTSHQASFESAQTQAYESYQGILSRGYTDSADWVRLTIAASTQPLVLRIAPAWLDSLTLYDPASQETPQTVGDRYPLQQRAFHGLGHSFALQASNASRDVWLRLQSTSAHLLKIEALPADQIPQTGIQNIIWATLYTAVLLLVLCVLLSIWWVQRDQILGTYLLRHAVYTYYGTAYLGLPTLLFSNVLPPAFFDLAFSISAIAIMPLGLLFDLTFLSVYRPNKHLLALLKVIAVLSMGLMLLLLAGYTSLALRLNIYIMIVAILIATLTAVSCKSTPYVEQIVPKKVMLVYYALIFSGLLIGLISVLGWLSFSEWTMYALILHGLVSGLMMTFILFVRAQRLAQKNQQMTWELQKAHQDMDLEQRQRHEQSQFLHMLMHELKTPLSVVALALGTKNRREENLELAGHAIQDMKAIIDRCVQADQLGPLTITQRKEVVDLPALVRQLALAIPELEARLHMAAAHNVPPLHTDQQLLQIILTNLLHNAARYSDPVTPIQVRVLPKLHNGQDGLAVYVINTPGLAGWPDSAQLFTKYYRSTGAQRDSGSGLGLFLARQLASSLGGSLDYTPSSQFVEFVLWIPLSPA